MRFLEKLKYSLKMFFSRVRDQDIARVYLTAPARETICPKCGIFSQRLQGRLILKVNGQHFQARKFPGGILIDEQLPNSDWKEVYRSGVHINDKKFIGAFELADSCPAP